MIFLNHKSRNREGVQMLVSLPWGKVIPEVNFFLTEQNKYDKSSSIKGALWYDGKCNFYEVEKNIFILKESLNYIGNRSKIFKFMVLHLLLKWVM